MARVNRDLLKLFERFCWRILHKNSLLKLLVGQNAGTQGNLSLLNENSKLFLLGKNIGESNFPLYHLIKKFNVFCFERVRLHQNCCILSYSYSWELKPRPPQDYLIFVPIARNQNLTEQRFSYFYAFHNTFFLYSTSLCFPSSERFLYCSQSYSLFFFFFFGKILIPFTILFLSFFFVFLIIFG